MKTSKFTEAQIAFILRQAQEEQTELESAMGAPGKVQYGVGELETMRTPGCYAGGFMTR